MDQPSGIKDYCISCTLVPVREYDKLAAGFNPVQFDAKVWATVAKQAGMKYLVLTATGPRLGILD